MSNKHAYLAALLWLSLAGAVAGCQQAPEREQEAVKAPPKATPEKVVAALDDGNEPAGLKRSAAAATGIDAIAGRWKVLESKGGTSQAAGQITGAIAEFYPESLRWSYRPKGAKGLNQLCREPVIAPLEKPAAKSALADDLEPLIDRSIKQAEGSTAQQILCAAGGDWGPKSGADFIILSDGRIAMRWHGGASIILERMVQAAPKQDMTREDYAADSYSKN